MEERGAAAQSDLPQNDRQRLLLLLLLVVKYRTQYEYYVQINQWDCS